LKECDAAFNLKGKVIGTKGENVQFIRSQTASRVAVKDGRGGQLLVEVSNDDEEKLKIAIDTVRDLLEQIYKDYETWLEGGDGGREEASKGREAKHTSHDKSREKGKGKGKEGKGKDRRSRHENDEPPLKRRRESGR